MPVSTRLVLAKLVRKKHKSCAFAEIVPDKEKYLLSIEPLDIDPMLMPDRQVVLSEPDVALRLDI